MKKYFITSIIIFALTAAAIVCGKREPELTLAELQKQYLLAGSDTTGVEQAKVIDRLEQYYLHLDVPDTLRQRVDREVAAILDTTKINLSGYTNGDPNVYKLEGQLQDLLRLAAIARAREDDQTFEELIGHAKTMAKTVDRGTQSDYWIPFVNEISVFTLEKAVYWLKAKRTVWLCWFYRDSTSKFVDVESYAALGLKFLQRSNDERVRLDLMQRLQYILYFHRSMNELSLGLAKKLLLPAERIKYHLRLSSIIYHQAEVLSSIEQYQAALVAYEKVIHIARTFVLIPGISWFEVPALLGEGKAYVELEEFERALEVCKEVEKSNLSDKDKIRLQRLRSDIFRATGNYELAEEELRKAITLAVSLPDTFNLIMCLNSFGAIFHELEEYDLALNYFNRAKALFKPTFPDIGTRMLVYNNIATAAIGKKDSAHFATISQEAQKTAKLANIPSQEAKLRHYIGFLYKEIREYDNAMRYLYEADSIYTASGLLRFALAAKVHYIDCLVGLSKYDEAKNLISRIDSLARQSNDIEGMIDAIGRLARIYYQEKNISAAVQTSNQLIYAVESLSSRFNNFDRLMAYRQKVYDFLKDAVFYEIVNRRLDSAFVKLEYAKAYALKSRFLGNYGNHFSDSIQQKYLKIETVISSLDKHRLIIDYMMTTDTLYVFALTQKGLQLLPPKGIKAEELKKTVAAYNDSINRTGKIFDHYSTRKVQSHYVGTVELAQKLHQYLLGWPELDSSLYDTELLYIIPDEVLFELPFATLIAKNSDNRSFLANHTAVVTFPSVDFLRNADISQASRAPDTKRVLICADRQFSGAEKFVAQVKKLFPLTDELTVEPNRLTKEEVLKEFKKNYQVFISLGHGLANQQDAERSYIELYIKTSDNSASNIRLSLSDLKGIKWLDTELVMLIGCDTAAGKLYRGTGVSGLHQGFLALGALNVLGNLWEVSADQTIAQAQNFIVSWATTWKPAQALRESQRKTIQQLQVNSYYLQPHPYFWGNFVLLSAKQQ